MKRTFSHNSSARALGISLLSCVVTLGMVALAFASGGEGGHGGGHGGAGQMKDFMWRCIDFAALVLILVWALKKSDVKGMLAGRSEGIAKALSEAEQAKAAADKKFAEYNDKLAKANQEIEEIQAAIRKEGLAEKDRIVAEAKVSAAKIIEQAQKTAEQEVLKARMELRQEAARLAVQLAENSLKAKIEAGDQSRLVDEYLTKVVELQ
jgi:F-type H+-transporting ATPase subunit b